MQVEPETVTLEVVRLRVVQLLPPSDENCKSHAVSVFPFVHDMVAVVDDVPTPVIPLGFGHVGKNETLISSTYAPSIEEYELPG